MKAFYVVCVILLGAVGIIVASRRIGTSGQQSEKGFAKRSRNTWFISIICGFLIAPLFPLVLPASILSLFDGPLALLVVAMGFLGMTILLFIMRDDSFPSRDLRETFTLGIRLHGATSSALLLLVVAHASGRL